MTRKPYHLLTRQERHADSEAVYNERINRRQTEPLFFIRDIDDDEQGEPFNYFGDACARVARLLVEAAEQDGSETKALWTMGPESLTVSIDGVIVYTVQRG